MLTVGSPQKNPLLAKNTAKQRSSTRLIALIALFLFIAALAFLYTNPVVETSSAHRYIEASDNEHLEADKKGGKGGGGGKKGGKGGGKKKGGKGGSSDECPSDPIMSG